MPSILIVDDEENMRVMLRAMLRQQGYDVWQAESAEKALGILDAQVPDFVLTDVRMSGMSGIDLVRKLVEKSVPTTILVMSAYGSLETAVEAMQAGAYDYIMKPFKSDEVVLTLRKAQEREDLRRENRELRERLTKERSFDGIISENPGMKSVFHQIDRIAGYKTTVLITGESGTGKELVARAIHHRSDRDKGPFVAVNCGAIPEHLLESELFGHRKGAFTDAVNDKQGLFEAAHSGTLFLDEIGELPAMLQVKLFRVLQEERIRRVGETRDIPVDVRILAATTRDLPVEIKEGRFREELYYRLNVVEIELPPLRARREDVPLLVGHFLARNNERFKFSIKGLEPEAQRMLANHAWPGNIRELENAVEHACLMADGSTVRAADLPESVQKASSPIKQFLATGETSIKKTVEYVEEVLIRRALELTGGNRTRAAKLLEISHRALLYKIKRYSII
ncbi:MAG: sigma-54-dependent Fis family transcriptional regulator [Deltaproteobacteria bacterium]|nr:sigma-54-dependent Fis family transcriptional regulator [Deltaproteobacteria bacterium]